MSRPASATERLARLLALVPWVAAHPDGVPVDEVCARFAVDREQLLDDIDTVMLVGVHPFTPDTMIEAWVDDDRVIIRYADTFARPLRLTAQEAVGLVTAAQGLAAVPGGDRHGPLQRAIDKLAGVLGPGGDPALRVDLGGASRDVFDLLDRARADRLQAEIIYPDADDATGHRRRIEPARLFSASGNWYVAGWCHRAGDHRVFRVDRIVSAEVTDEAFTQEVPDTPDAVRIDEAAPQVELEVDRSTAWLLDTVPVVQRHDRGDTVGVTLAVGSPRWLARLLVQLGPTARIVASDPRLPAAELARAEAARIRARYP